MKISKNKNLQKNQLVPKYTPIRSIFDEFFMMPSLMDDIFTGSSYSNLSADIWEEGDNFFVKMALPGIAKEDVSIEIDADIVRIKGERKIEEKDESKKKYYFKSMESSFEQSFNLPSVVDADKADASFKDGVLEIKLPKAEQYKPKKIEISK